MKKTIAVLVLLLVIGAGALAWSYHRSQKGQPIGPMACTQEAMRCPDGSFVGRTGPNCEFAACPTSAEEQTHPDWLTFTDMAQGISFLYPEVLGTKYISTQEWPPKITTSDQAFSCAAPQLGIPANTNPTKMINGRNYCVIGTAEGAAGTTYTTYDYSTMLGGKFVKLHFVLRFPQCGNYPDPQKTECENERTAFDLDGMIDQIAQSVKAS